MTSRDFAYWLQGFFEIRDLEPEKGKRGMTTEQIELVRKHLNMVFKHDIDPSFGDDLPDLTKIHSGIDSAFVPSDPFDFPRINC